MAAQSSLTYSSAKNKVLWETYRLNKLKKYNAQKFWCEIIIIFKALVNICAIIEHNWNKFTKQVSICLPHSADNEIRRISFVRKPFFISYQIKTDLRENIFPFRHSAISPLPLAQINYARRAQLEPPSTQPIAKGIGSEVVKERELCLVLSNCFSFGASPERKSPFHAELLIELHGIMSCVCVLSSVCVSVCVRVCVGAR